MRHTLLSAIALLSFLAAGCATTRLNVPGTGIGLPIPALPIPGLPLLGRGEGDLRHLTWSNAFIAMHERIKREYPFTEHKQIDWDALQAKFEPKIEQAELDGNAKHYYVALREYLYAIPDSHVGISTEDAFRHDEVGGGFGFSVAPLSDGRVLVHWVQPNGPAAAAGLEVGAEIVQWQGKPVREAAQEWPVTWAYTPPATPEARLRTQLRMLFRAPVDTHVEMAFRNPGSETPWVARVDSFDDDDASIKADLAAEHDLEELESPIDSEMLAGQIGLIRLHVISATVNTPFFAKAFEEALRRLVEGGARGLVLDLRDNEGGVNALAGIVAGHFLSAPTFFESVAYFNAQSGAFETDAEEHLEVQPNPLQWQGPTVLLVNRNTRGAAEGLARLLSSLPGTTVMGHEQTSATFSRPGGGVMMPKGYTVFYPVGRSLDANGTIQIESDAEGQGGVAVDVLVPFDEAAFLAQYVEKTDPLLDAAIAHLQQ